MRVNACNSFTLKHNEPIFLIEAEINYVPEKNYGSRGIYEKKYS